MSMRQSTSVGQFELPGHSCRLAVEGALGERGRLTLTRLMRGY
jgi:hypothetical protein